MNEMLEILLANVQLALPFLVVGFLNGILGAVFFYLSLLENDPPGILQTLVQLVLVFVPVFLFQAAYSSFFAEVFFRLENPLWLAPLLIALLFVPFYLGDLLANIFEGGIKKRAARSFEETLREIGL